jgi:hypothetical protein
VSSEQNENLGRLDDDAEQAEPSSTTEGAAADGEYDPAQGSPGQEHPVGEDFPDEAVRYDEPDERGRTDTAE